MNFLVFSDDWGVHPSSCQHIFRILSRTHPTVWVNTVGMRPPRLDWADARKVLTKVSRMLRPAPAPTPSPSVVEDEGRRVRVCAPFMLPFQRPAVLRQWSSRSVVRRVRRELAASDMTEYCLVTTVPNVWEAVPRLGASRVVYYCVDDFSEWPGLEKESILAMEQRLLRSVDRMICTSSALHERFASAYPTTLLTHGVDLATFAGDAGKEHRLLDDIPAPRVGYFGLFDQRTDHELLAAVATRLPGVSFVITGPTEGGMGSLGELENVHFTGPVAYDELPAVVSGWKACLLPYRINALTENINPLKLKEYLASGKPVLSTPLPEAQRLAPHVRIAASVEDWCAVVRSAVDGDWTVDRDERLAFLGDHTWDCKAEEFLRICQGENEKQPQ